MTLLFSSMFAGVSVIWDREFGFLKEMLVAPMSRTSIVLGRVLGGASISVFQACIILVIGFLLGLKFLGVESILAALVFMALASMGFVAVGVAIASLLNDVEGFQVIINFVIFPIFFLSNALFPLDKLPTWLQAIASANPLSWAVGALRDVLVYGNYSNLLVPLVLLLVFDVAAILVAGRLFNKTGI
jgi:ABC-2 type transport system permease protein